ncbi:hypothetical protein Acr_23g0015490 [Actinidia rufa]|uniref:Uncharacterized protein n=1 Tax=Actinidia rufa TaxID=165716 RepID=A0A7J0GRA5_9ERIC|nr:hypothetical protein Acr_23g0015490 [Actinidia rufa]
MSSRKWQGRSLSPLDVALSPGSPVGCHRVIRPKDYALRQHLWGELNYVLYSYAQKTLLPRKKKPCVQEEDEEREAQARCLSPGRVIMTWSERHLYSSAVRHADLLQ